MMVIDNLKEIWNSQQESKIRFTESDIYKMIHKKSTSIVKWIFYISIFEFVLFLVLPFFMEDMTPIIDEMHMNTFYYVANILSYAFGVGFIVMFYKNFKTICVQDTSKKLMKDILKTRKTVKFYVGFQLLLGGATSLVLILKSNTILPENINQNMIWVVAIISVIIVLIVVWLFYTLIYGVLLKRLKNNYNELLKAEN